MVSRTHERGFTLMELMVAVAIVAITAAIALPSMGRARAEGKMNEIALDIVRVARQARAASAAYGRAHLLRFTGASNGAVEVYRSTNNTCGTEAFWNTQIVAGGCAGNRNCIGYVEADQWTTVGTNYRIGSPSGDFDLCFEPLGSMRWKPAGPGRFRTDNNMGGAFELQVSRADGAGVTRKVVIPFGGDARILR